MGINQLVSSAVDYIQANLAGSVAAAVILLYLLIKKPKIFLILLAVAGVTYFFIKIYSKLSATGLGN